MVVSVGKSFMTALSNENFPAESVVSVKVETETAVTITPGSPELLYTTLPVNLTKEDFIVRSARVFVSPLLRWNCSESVTNPVLEDLTRKSPCEIFRKLYAPFDDDVVFNVWPV